MLLQSFFDLPYEEKQQLRQLDLQGNDFLSLSSAGWEQFRLALANCEQLEEIDLSNTEPNCFILSGRLTKCRQLKVLYLNDNDLGTETFSIHGIKFAGLCTLIAALVECHQLQTLHLANNNLGGIDPVLLGALAANLAKYPSLQILNLAHNNLGTVAPNGLRKFAKKIARCPQLQILNLAHNNLGAAETNGFRFLLDRLLLCQTIRYIDLRNNALNESQQSWINLRKNAFNANYNGMETLLLCWNSLNKQKASGSIHSLGTLPKEIIVGMLMKGGYIHKVKTTGNGEYIEIKTPFLQLTM